MYNVIEFTKNCGGGLGVINETWLTPRRKQCFWPPFKNQKMFNKCLANKDEPEENWQIYDIERHYYQTCDLDIALRKLKTAEETSDLQTEEEEILRKRKRKPPRRFSTSSSDDAESMNVCHKRPPQLKLNPLILKDNSSTTSEYQNSEASSSKTPGLYKRTKQSNFVPFKKIDKGSITTIDNNKEKFPIDFPLETFENLNFFEEFVVYKKNYSNVVENFSNIGGKDPKTKTYRLLKHILKDELAQHFSFFGKRGGKKAFINLKLCAIILGKYI
ncbi:hypothetical protein ABEB36_014404 [Hypothenemus hampei]|uniref:DUF4806 domain-containing protein n=1 Tax=Hypothenemus hampei TaxID=57062 RepID=A0ABD1E1Z3_HYPHA